MLSVHFYINGKFILASILFSLALNFKQMELYHALPIFIFLLSKSFSRYDSIRMTLMRLYTFAFIFYLSKIWTYSTYNISKHAATVLAVFFVVWAPFILADTKLLFQIVKRIFPLNRGIYEVLIVFLIIWNHVSESCSKFLVYCFTGRQNQRYPCSGCNGSLLVYFNYL